MQRGRAKSPRHQGNPEGACCLDRLCRVVIPCRGGRPPASEGRGNRRKARGQREDAGWGLELTNLHHGGNRDRGVLSSRASVFPAARGQPGQQ